MVGVTSFVGVGVAFFVGSGVLVGEGVGVCLRSFTWEAGVFPSLS